MRPMRYRPITTIARLLARLLRDERGVTLVEYGIAITLVVVLGTAGLLALSNEIDVPLNNAASMMPD